MLRCSPSRKSRPIERFRNYLDKEQIQVARVTHHFHRFGGNMFRRNRRLLVLMAIMAWGVLAGYQSIAMGFPAKPITMIIPYPAGGSSDGTGRALSNSARKYLGQPVIVENKPGGGGTVGPSLLVTKPADGYTLCAFPPFGTAVAWHMGKLSFNPLDDVTRIIRYTGTHYGIVVRAEAPWRRWGPFLPEH